jgi:hypothetical protein
MKWIALAAAALAALAAAAVASAGTDDRHLLRTYQPVTVLDPAERFRPTRVQAFLDDAELQRLENGAWTPAGDRPLPAPGTGAWRLDQRSCSPALPLGGLACYAAAAADEPGSTVYGRVARAGDRTVLQYWLFYYDNVYSYVYAPPGALWQAHEGDWEVVNVVLGADGAPLEVGYSRHCLGARRAWAATPRRADTHPVVYVSAGSHANYFAPGVTPFDVRCVPSQVRTLLQQLGLPLPADVTGDGATAGPRRLAGEETELKVLDDSTWWLAFDGYWGEAQYFHSPFTGTVPFGTAPVGPAYHAVWRDPLGTLATWPEG